MKMLFGCVVALFLCCNSALAESDKASQIQEFQSIQAKVLSLAVQSESPVPRRETVQQIEQLIHKQLSSEQLYRLGIALFLSGAPGRASDARMDNVFFYASNRCAILLSDRPGPEIYDDLQEMKGICGKDGAEALFYEGLLEKQKSLR